MTVIPTVVVYNHFAEFDTTVTSLETVMQVAQLQPSYQSATLQTLLHFPGAWKNE